MNRKAIFLILFVQAGSLMLRAQQSSAIPNSLRISGTIDRILARNNFQNGQMLYVVSPAPGKVIGDAYLHTYWSTGAILLNDKDQIIEGYPLRYDIANDELEIKSNAGIKVLKSDRVKSFMWLDSLTNTPQYFVAAAGYAYDGKEKPKGYLQIIADGALPALKQTVVHVRKPDYRPELHMGKMDTYVLKREKFYYTADSHLYPIPSSRKKFIAIFGTSASEIDKFIDANNLSLSSEYHLKTIFDHYNNRLNTSRIKKPSLERRALFLA